MFVCLFVCLLSYPLILINNDSVYKKQFKYALFLFAFVFVILEVSLRLFGVIPNSLDRYKSGIHFYPYSPFVKNNLIGFSCTGGVYSYIGNGLRFDFSVNENGTRFTGKNPLKPTRKINIYGCSYFWGYGLNDTSTFGYKLKMKLPENEINNYALFGHGLTSEYLLLANAIRVGDKPDIAICSYADFYDERNIFSPTYKRKIVSKQLGVFSFPVASINKQNVLNIALEPIQTFSLPFYSHSAVLFLCQSFFDQVSSMQMEEEKVRGLLLKEIIDLCEKNKIKLLLVRLHHDNKTDFKKLFENKKYSRFIDLEIDVSNPKYSLAPVDFHPNASTHSMYADSIYNSLIAQ